jgi:hypothetical protein
MGCEGLEREITNRRIVTAAGETKKGALPFGGVASSIAAIRRRNYRLRIVRKRKARECERCESGTDDIRFGSHDVSSPVSLCGLLVSLEGSDEFSKLRY